MYVCIYTLIYSNIQSIVGFTTYCSMLQHCIKLRRYINHRSVHQFIDNSRDPICNISSRFTHFYPFLHVTCC